MMLKVAKTVSWKHLKNPYATFNAKNEQREIGLTDTQIIPSEHIKWHVWYAIIFYWTVQ